MATRDIQMSNTTDNYKFVRCWDDPEEYNFTGAVKDKYGSIVYYENGKCHREDGPAIIYANGNKEWYIHGKCHREDGPAIDYSDGGKRWYIHGKRHREDGPAVELANGRKLWYYNGEYYDKDDNFTVESWTKKWKLEIFK